MSCSDRKATALFAAVVFPAMLWIATACAPIPLPKDAYRAAPDLLGDFDALRGEVEGWREARVLTDDQAPVELAWDLMTLEYVR